MMTDPSPPQDADLVEHHGCRIRLSPSGLDWMALVEWPGQPILIMAPEREKTLVKACEWIDRQLVSDKTPY